jgi:hypothetical protein
MRKNKPLTWKKKDVKSKFHSNKIMLITDRKNQSRSETNRETFKNSGFSVMGSFKLHNYYSESDCL